MKGQRYTHGYSYKVDRVINVMHYITQDGLNDTAYKM